MFFPDGKQRANVEDSPVWVPDAEASVCMHCKKSEFSVFNRRVSLHSFFYKNYIYVCIFVYAGIISGIKCIKDHIQQ